MAKKKGNNTKAAKSGETSSIFPLLFLIVYAVATIFLVSQFVNEPFMEYLKGFRVLWVSIFWIYIGLLCYNMFSKLDFLKPKYMVIAFVALVATGFLLRMNNALFFGGDSGLYLVLAKSLATFQGFQEIHMPNPIPHQYYGFGLPLLLAPVFVFGLGVGAANFMIVLTSVGFAIFSFLVFRKYIRFEFALLISTLVCFNWSFIYYSSLVMTELPFCFFMMMTIYFFDKYANDQNALSKYLFISAGLAFFAYSIKPVGIGLVAAGALYLLLINRDWKKSVYFGSVFLVGFALWNARIYFETGTLGYVGALSTNVLNEGVQFGKEGTEGFGFFGNLFVKPFRVLLNSHEIFIPTIFQFMWTPNIVVKILLTLVLYVGFVVRLVRNRSICEFVTIIFFYGIVMYAYILEPSRYYLPLIPFIYFYFFSGLEFLFSTVASAVKITRGELLSGLAVLSVASLFFVPHIVVVNRTIWQDNRGSLYASSPPFQEYYDMAMWIKDNVPKDATLASRLDKEMFILTGIKGVNARVYPNYDLQWTEDKGKLIIGNLEELIKQNDVDYYVLDSTRPDSRMTQVSLARNTKTLNEMFTAVYRSKSGQSYILRVRDEWKKNK